MIDEIRHAVQEKIKVIEAKTRQPLEYHGWEPTGEWEHDTAGDTASDTVGDTAGDTVGDTVGDTAGESFAPPHRRGLRA